MQPAIRIENLGKSYRVNHAVERGGYRTLRESLTDLATAPLRRLRNPGHDGRVEEFWALKDVSFDVQPGEVVGIIGRNGAGKSTLLKILSRVTKPTKGSVTINGRVGSLLEVGTGFHPELTGRENIYMNGSILGMSRREISRKFDEIVEFSGVSQFIDTPVKRFSSGMQVRLAFSVAAHLEPEIVLVDEVLAVGDMSFQRKCFGKMKEVARSGRTVLLVTHQLSAVDGLCDRGIVLEAGEIYYDGPAGDAVDKMLDLQSDRGTGVPLGHRQNRRGTGAARVESIALFDKSEREREIVRAGEPVSFQVHIRCVRPTKHPELCLIVSNHRGQRLFRLYSKDTGVHFPDFASDFAAECRIDALNLMPGEYTVAAKLFSGGEEGECIDEIEDAFRFSVAAGDVYGTGTVPGSSQDVFFVPCVWSGDSPSAPALADDERRLASDAV